MLIRPETFWNFTARRYARNPVKDLEAYQYKLDKTAEHLSPKDRLLEFGCGTGTTALIHSARVSHIDAIDFSTGMIAIAREKAENQGVKNVRFEMASLDNWPLPEDDYDAVLGMSILHLVPDLDATLERVHQSLKPGGLFFSSTACVADMARVLRYVLPPLGAIGVLPKVNFLTADKLKERLSAHGLAIEHSWQPGAAAAVFIIARRQ